MADVLSRGKSWGKSFLDAIGFLYEEPTSSRTPRTKRKAKDDGRRSTKKPHYSPAHYRAASYAAAPLAQQIHSHNRGKGKAQNRTSNVGRMKLVGRRSSEIGNSEEEPITKAQLAAKQQPMQSKTPATTRVKASTRTEEPWQPGMSTQEKRTTRPNKMAREIAARTNDAKRQVQASVQEPEYALRDVEIRDGLWQMMNLIEDFANLVSVGQVYPVDASGNLPRDWWANMQPDTAKVIGCVASGGPGGVRGWADLLIDEQKRRALICAVIGKVFVEQVFQHIFFGGTAEDIKAITHLQMKHRNDDGFDRNRHYAAAIRTILLHGKSKPLFLPSNFASHVAYITTVIFEHVCVFNSAIVAQPLINDLLKIVTHAGILSLLMRIDEHTVYYFEPVFKEDTFTSERMECFNFKDMQQRNPRTADDEPALEVKEKQRRAKSSEEEKKRAKSDEPLTQITIMDGVTAYRLGGWESATSTNTNIKYEKFQYRKQGIRARILTHGWVYCRWGRARRFKDGKPDDVEDVHGDAWKAPGFVEFSAVDGVVDWLEKEKREVEVKRKEWEKKHPKEGKGQTPVVSSKNKEKAAAYEEVQGSTDRRKSSLSESTAQRQDRSANAGTSRVDSAFQDMQDEAAAEAQISSEMQARVDAEC